ncbi:MULTISPECIES: OsmC family protein [Gemella]|uniref:OsmC family protein n=1 Tax=Gemella TaxID=1378 RepID=UPI000767FBD0|nr:MULTISPECIES: hypothetical protein [Gemella]AME10117.1 hypothetical protein AXE85_08125 [Gemella sp. oral taxon 928]AXI26253.1 hypothetical protein CG018_01720 [Gemella sp. ND 6198]
MYKIQGTIKEGFTTTAVTSSGGEYRMFIEENIDGPMDLFSVAYVGCISMCAKGYFVRTYALKNLQLNVELTVDYDNKKIVADIYVDRTEEQLVNGDRQGVLDNIKLRCKVSHLLTSDLDINYNVKRLKK